MTPHNHAKPGDYAEAVLLPGDPLRAKWIAETFFTDAKLVNSVRNCLGYTGTWNGKPVSVQATGMGQPSTAIYAHELMNVYGAKTLIRVGTCGGLTTKVQVRDVILGASAATDSTIVKDAFGPYNYAPAADFSLLRHADDAVRQKGKTVHVGGLVSSDIFYHSDPLASYSELVAHGVLGVEMEAGTLYTLAARFNARALAVCTVSDCLVTGAELDPDARQSSLEGMVTIALEVATR